jgi:hypothetical protein
LANLPDALAPLIEKPNWVCWKWQWRVNEKTGIGKWSKPPFQPTAPDQLARPNDPQTWGSYEEALKTYQARLCDGIGFCLFNTDKAAFDFDNARDPVTGRIAREAEDYVTRANSYAEVSVSGTGLHVIGLGNGPKVHRKQKIEGSDIEIESYRGGADRYIIITGAPLEHHARPLANIDAVIDSVVGELDGDLTRDDLDQWIKHNRLRYAELDDTRDARRLPAELKQLIASPSGADLSADFHHAVCWLADYQWSVSAILELIENELIVPERFCDRLEREICRCLWKRDRKARIQAQKEQPPQEKPPQEKPRPQERPRPQPRPTPDPEETFSALDLGAMTFPPLKYVIPDIIVEGLTLLAGKPKIGKSWLLMEAAIAVADRGITLGGIRCEQGDALYCALEDNKRRLQDRMKILTGNANPETWPARLHFRCTLPRLAEGGIEDIEDWIKAAEHPRLVIVDTLAMVRNPKGRDQSSYEADYDSVRALRDLASTYHIAIIVVHHLRKAAADDAFDTVSGTLGLTGATDSVLVLYYEAMGVVLKGKGRDLLEFEKALAFNKDAARWVIKGDADEVRRSTERNMILAAIDEAAAGAAGPLGPQQIASAVNMKVVNVKFLLGKLVTDGVIERVGYGRYRRRDTPASGAQNSAARKNSSPNEPRVSEE